MKSVFAYSNMFLCSFFFNKLNKVNWKPIYSKTLKLYESPSPWYTSQSPLEYYNKSTPINTNISNSSNSSNKSNIIALTLIGALIIFVYCRRKNFNFN